MDYQIDYDWTFILLWGSMFSFAAISGGPLLLAMNCMMLLVLISHEHAHLLECERFGIKVNWVKFTWLGGAVNADLQDPHETIHVLSAGVIDTLCYAVAFIGIAAGAFLLGTVQNWNWADPTGTVQRLQFVQSLVFFAVIMTASNILPIEYHSKEYGLITTDGWAVLITMEAWSEFMNDGRALAAQVGES